jgi:peptidoglycan/LPS O-acetylase OafA/YrhL
MLLEGEGPIVRALSAPMFRSIATLGYGVYLVHMPLMQFVYLPVVHALHDRGVASEVLWVASLVAVVVGSTTLSYLLHILVEKPSLRFRERIAA